jgi:hypothetical protein
MKSIYVLLALFATLIGRSSSAAESAIRSSVYPNGVLSVGESRPLVPEMIAHHSEVVGKMLAAVAKADFPGFLFQGDKRFQAFDQEKFSGLTRIWGNRLSTGYEVTYLGELKRDAAATTVWRIQFKDKSADALVVLITNSGGSASDIMIY